MHLGKFYAAISSIVHEVGSLEIKQKLSQLQNALKTSINGPNDANAKAFRDIYEGLF